MRPRKYYVLFALGQAVDIIEGCAAARRLHAWGSFRTRLAAEEFSAWWNYTAFAPGGHLAHLNTTGHATGPSFPHPRPS